jgi:SAICAR synthetase
MAYVESNLQSALPLVASGKVRDLYEINSKELLFVATDRISAYDVIMKNVSVVRTGTDVQLTDPVCVGCPWQGLRAEPHNILLDAVPSPADSRPQNPFS